MILRNFLYLDTSMLNDYLSSLEGYVIESGELIENKTTSTSGEGSVKVIKAGREVANETGKISRIKSTDASNFQKLYDLLEDQGMIQFLECFDETIWNSIKRNEIIEVQGNISVCEKYATIEQVGNITPFVDLMKAFGQSDLIDDEGLNAINGLKAVSDINSNSEIPIIIDFDFSDKYTVGSKLSKDFIRTNMGKLDGEITIVGKVLKVVPVGQSYELFSMVAGLDSIVKHQNRKQRRQNNTSNKQSFTQEVADKVDGPAVILIPLAIFR